jgi:hypothetical protein
VVEGSAKEAAMRKRMRIFSLVLASTLLVGGFLATKTRSASATAPSCFGLKATIVATGGADFLTGTAKRDVIVGLGGNDNVPRIDNLFGATKNPNGLTFDARVGGSFESRLTSPAHERAAIATSTGS